MIAAVLHIENEQPLRADLYRIPEPNDAGLLCTNVRMLNGKRPIFVDDMSSVFFFPYRIIRFVEIPPTGERPAEATQPTAARPAVEEPEADLEVDEDFLRRVREI